MDINNIYFYLLLGVFLYFLFTYVLENYLVEQENFDPSLVPVSSIVTLAKVAQKLVNGNGTLTNPGNLQIGKDVGASSGNLTVTGKTAIGSTTMGDKTLNVTGTLGVSGKAVINAAGVPSDITNYPDLTVGGSMGVTGNTSVMGNLDVTGTTTMKRTLNVDGVTTLNKPLTIKSGDKWGNTLNLLQGTETTGAAGEPPYINFMQKDGTTRNAFIMGRPEGILLNAPVTEVSGALGVTGNLNARTVEGYNTRVGGIWTSGGIYAEGTSNLEIGAGSSNVFIGAANGGAKNNLIVTGNVNPNSFYLIYASWSSFWQGWQDDFRTYGGIQRTFEAANTAGAKTCTWDWKDHTNTAFDPHPYVDKPLKVIYKCGLNGAAKYTNTPTFNCP